MALTTRGRPKKNRKLQTITQVKSQRNHSLLPAASIWPTLTRSKTTRKWSPKSSETQSRKRIGLWSSRSSNFSWMSKSETTWGILSSPRIPRSSASQNLPCLNSSQLEIRLWSTKLEARLTSSTLTGMYSKETKTLRLFRWVPQIATMTVSNIRKKMKALKSLKWLKNSSRLRSQEMSSLARITQLQLGQTLLEAVALWGPTASTTTPQTCMLKSLSMEVEWVLMLSCRRDLSTSRAFMASVEIWHVSKKGQIWRVRQLLVRIQTTRSLNMRTWKHFSTTRVTTLLRTMKAMRLSMCLLALRLTAVKCTQGQSFSRNSKASSEERRWHK